MEGNKEEHVQVFVASRVALVAVWVLVALAANNAVEVHLPVCRVIGRHGVREYAFDDSAKL